MHVCMCVYVCTYVRMYVCMYVCVCVYIFMYVCMCVYVSMYVCVCVCLSLWQTNNSHLTLWGTGKRKLFLSAFRCVFNWAQFIIQNIYYTEAPFFRRFLRCVSYIVHCRLSELCLIYQIYFRQWQIFNTTRDKIIHFISCYLLLLFPCHAGHS
jgi:hypothetical protein